MNAVTIAIAAARKNVSTSAIQAAIRRKNIVQNIDGTIDLEDPRNVAYFSTPKQRHIARTKHADYNRNRVLRDNSFDAYSDYCEECKDEGVKPEPFGIWESSEAFYNKLNTSNIVDASELSIRKIHKDIQYRETQILKNDIANGLRMGAIVDLQTLQTKFGAFRDLLLNELLTLPDSVAEVLWQKAKESEDPVLSISQTLQDHLTHIIQRAKEAAISIIPSEVSIRYVLEDDE